MDMFPHTITIYHRIKQDGAEKWLRFVVSNVLWNENKGGIMRKTGTTSIDSITVYIPMSVMEGAIVSDGDIVVKGISGKEIEKSPKEIANMHIITNVDIKDVGGTQAHCEVTAK